MREKMRLAGFIFLSILTVQLYQNCALVSELKNGPPPRRNDSGVTESDEQRSISIGFDLEEFRKIWGAPYQAETLEDATILRYYTSGGPVSFRFVSEKLTDWQPDKVRAWDDALALEAKRRADAERQRKSDEVWGEILTGFHQGMTDYQQSHRQVNCTTDWNSFLQQSETHCQEGY